MLFKIERHLCLKDALCTGWRGKQGVGVPTNHPGHYIVFQKPTL